MKELESYFPSNLSAGDVFDGVATRGISLINKVKEAYKKMQPECPI